MCWLVEELDWSSSLDVSLTWRLYRKHDVTSTRSRWIWKVLSNHREQFRMLFTQSVSFIQKGTSEFLKFGFFKFSNTFCFRLPHFPRALSTTTTTATPRALSMTMTAATLAGDRPPHKFSSPIMSAIRSPSIPATLAEARPGKAKHHLGKVARAIKTGVVWVLRVGRRARMARMWPLLQVLMLLGPVVLARPSHNLVLERDYEDVVVKVEEEEMDPGPRETRCTTKDGPVSTRAG